MQDLGIWFNLKFRLYLLLFGLIENLGFLNPKPRIAENRYTFSITTLKVQPNAVTNW
jgi:hypothetical protein